MKIIFQDHQLKTTPVKTFGGDLVFTDKLQCDKTDLETKAQLSIWQLRGEEEIKLGRGDLQTVGVKPSKRVTLMDGNKERIGEAYVDSQQEDK